MDPITCITVATTAFNTIAKLAKAGQDIDSIMDTVGKWAGAVSDFNRAEQDVKNPPMFKKLFFSKSVEEEALAIFTHKKRIQQQEYELKTLIEMYYGPRGWQDLIDMRRKIRAERERTVYRQREMRKNFIEATLAIICVLGIFGLCGGVGYFLYMYT